MIHAEPDSASLGLRSGIRSFDSRVRHLSLVVSSWYIRITCSCDLYPLKPHCYIVKLGFTGVYIFSIFALKRKIVGTR